MVWWVLLCIQYARMSGIDIDIYLQFGCQHTWHDYLFHLSVNLLDNRSWHGVCIITIYTTFHTTIYTALGIDNNHTRSDGDPLASIVPMLSPSYYRSILEPTKLALQPTELSPFCFLSKAGLIREMSRKECSKEHTSTSLGFKADLWPPVEWSVKPA